MPLFPTHGKYTVVGVEGSTINFPVTLAKTLNLCESVCVCVGGVSDESFLHSLSLS